jgi:hypothetical protein
VPPENASRQKKPRNTAETMQKLGLKILFQENSTVDCKNIDLQLPSTTSLNQIMIYSAFP